MPRQVYLLKDKQLTGLTERAYDAEALLQELLAEHPRLLAGEQVDVASPRRWLLVAREVGVPDATGAVGRWALDHLFLDQDGVPTLVEVKRSSDTRIRREVVGQMLDYAANALTYWPLESIRARFVATCESTHRDPTEVLTEFVGEAGIDAFWQQVKTNLQAGRIRLLFVADAIPPELRRVVEFLNDQMDPAEVLALEVRQFVGEGLTTLVPTVIGQTARAEAAKSGRSPDARQWDEASFFDELRSRRDEQDVVVARRVVDWMVSRSLQVQFGRGKQDGSLYPIMDIKDTRQYFFVLWTYGSAEVQFESMQRRPPFADRGMRRDLLDRLNTIEGVTIGEDALVRRPSIPLAALRSDAAMKRFLDAFDWEVGQILEWARSSGQEREPEDPLAQTADSASRG